MLNIAGWKVAIAPVIQFASITDFSSDGMPHLHISCHSTARFLIGQLVFNADSAWELRADALQRQFVFRNNRTTEPMLTLTLDSRTPKQAILAHDGSQTLAEWLFAYPTLQLLLSEWLAHNDGLLIHACGVIDEDHALIFTGPPEIGKSTTARLWAEQGATILSDDRIALRWHDDQLWAYGTPWHSSTPLVSAKSAPVRAIFALKHGQINRITGLSPSQMLRYCLPELYLPRWNDQATQAALASLDRLLDVPSYMLEFVPDDSVVEYVRQFCRS